MREREKGRKKSKRNNIRRCKVYSFEGRQNDSFHFIHRRGLISLTSPSPYFTPTPISTCPPRGVNFINLFTCSFYVCRSQKSKKLLDLTVFFSLLGFAGVNAARTLVAKIDPSSPSSHLVSLSTFLLTLKHQLVSD